MCVVSLVEAGIAVDVALVAMQQRWHRPAIGVRAAPVCVLRVWLRAYEMYVTHIGSALVGARPS
jgi:hypothetical protein